MELAGEALTSFAEPYVEATFHFSYLPFAWLSPGPPALVYAHMATNVIAALFVTLGLYYRAATIVLTIGLSTLFLMEKSAYINHTYLYCLFAGILACIPANAAVSLDANRRPEIQRDRVPAWTVYLLRFQIGVVYIFAGIAKLDADWLSAMPLTLWLSHRATYPLIGPLLVLPETAYLMSWAGLALDLLIVPAMLWGKTRRQAFTLIVAFHLSNVIIFGIGTFPWFSIVATTLFFPPETFRKLSILKDRLPPWTPRATDEYETEPLETRRITRIAAALAVFVCIQIAVPCRHFFYEGNPAWTEAGHTFAWRMMLRTKRGRLEYKVRDVDTGERWTEHAQKYLTPNQLSETVGDPDMILQLAHHIRDEQAGNGRRVEVNANALVRMNGRPARRLIDPEVDLARVERRLGVYDFVLPFDDSVR
jgi:hypothetical protein